jgi:hypothetical protein
MKMKNSSLLILSSVILSSVVWGAESESWSVQSTEKQFEKTSEVIFKSFDGKETKVLSAIPSTQSKQATTAPNKQDTQAKTLLARPVVKALYQDFWVFDAWVEFYTDEDSDGYYNHFSVEFDADTEFSSAEVYARLYLGKDEVFKEYHTTSNFSIFSDTSTDSFVVESELLNGFAPDDYEVLIELYDAYSNELVAVFDGNDDADLYLLSLESIEYESVQVVVVHEHGGSLSLWALFLIPLILVRRFYQKI